jgi:predicted amidohydrolase
LAESDGNEPEVILADIDPMQSAQARARLPSLHHDRVFGGPL